MKRKVNFILSILILIMSTSAMFAQSDSDEDFKTMENLQNENEDYYLKIYRVVDNYPDFTYKYVYNNDMLKEVIVSGVDNTMDRKRLEVWLYDLNKNRMDMNSIPTRTGIYYSVDRMARPKAGFKAFYHELKSDLTYPEAAKEAGVEGLVFVKFVVDSNGNVAFIKADEDIEASNPEYAEMLEKEAINIVKSTSGEWEPAEVDNRAVASWIVLPVKFDVRQDPFVHPLL